MWNLKKALGTALPPNAIAATMGLCTLSNCYNVLGLSGVRHLCMLWGLLVWLIALLKIVTDFQQFKGEYLQPIPGSLYAAWPMLMAILAGYFHDILPWPQVGLVIWYLAVTLHALHILYFTWRNVLKAPTLDGFTPTWFVTYVGILVPVVAGGTFGNPVIMKGLMIYGFLITFTIVPAMIWRLWKKALAEVLRPTFTIFLAPFSLTLIAYLTMAKQPQPWLANLLYVILLGFIIAVIVKLPSFVAGPFTIAFAALTFPLAIATLATARLGAFLKATIVGLSSWYDQAFGLLLFLTTAVIVPIVFTFARRFIAAGKGENF